MVKIKPAANEALSEASGDRRSVMPAQVLTFPSARGKAAPCLVHIPRYSSPQREEDSRTSADLSLHPFPKRAPSLQGASRLCSECVHASPCRRPLSLHPPRPRPQWVGQTFHTSTSSQRAARQSWGQAPGETRPPPALYVDSCQQGLPPKNDVTIAANVH